MRNNCDKCHGEIKNNECSCGFWIKNNAAPPLAKTLERAIMAYDHHCEQKNDDTPLSGDHYSGNCFVFFKGDYEDVSRVREFIEQLRKENAKQ